MLDEYVDRPTLGVNIDIGSHRVEPSTTVGSEGATTLQF